LDAAMFKGEYSPLLQTRKNASKRRIS
jgi:hypothetical protein